MSSRLIFVIQIAGSIAFFVLIAIWYATPRLARLPVVDALSALLLLYVTRTVGLTFVVPGLVGPDLPRSFAAPAACGDLVAAILALTSIVALRTRMRFAFVVVWLLWKVSRISSTPAFKEVALIFPRTASELDGSS